MGRVRIRWNRSAFAEIRTSAAVLSALDDLAEGVAARAGEGYEARPATVSGGRKRGRAAVITATAAAMIDEAQNHTLEGAL